MKPEPPTHIVKHSADRDAICGARHAIPRVAAQFVAAHIAGHGLIICEDCHLEHFGTHQEIPGQMGLWT